MILTCPECESRFLVPSEALLPNGRKVRCASCGHTWFQEPDQEEIQDTEENPVEEIPEAIKPIPEGSSVPVITEEKNPKATIVSYAIAVGIFFIVLGILFAAQTPITRVASGMTGFYALFGSSPSIPGEGLAFDKVQAKIEAEQTIKLKGRIINLTSQEKTVPMIRASLKDDYDKIVEEWIIDISQTTLQAEGDVSFESSYKPYNTKAQKIEVAFTISTQPSSKPKTASKGDGNNHALPEDGHDHQSDHAKSSESPARGGGLSHQESLPHLDSHDAHDQADHTDPAHGAARH